MRLRASGVLGHFAACFCDFNKCWVNPVGLSLYLAAVHAASSVVLFSLPFGG